MSIDAVTMTRLVLEGQLAFGGVSNLKNQLSAALEAGVPVLIDANGVECADTAAVQLLAAFVFYAKKGDLWSGWYQPSEAIRDAASQLNLDQHLCFEDGAQP